MRSLIGTLLLILLLGPAARTAEEVPVETRMKELLCATLSGARFLAVVEGHLTESDETVLAMVSRIAEIGGPAPSRSLARLIECGSDPVRLAALDVVTSLRIREDTLRKAVLERLANTRPESAEFKAALRALGWVGDGRDAPKLIDLCEHPQDDVASLAKSAFRSLSGSCSSSHSAPRRRQWWTTVHRRSTTDVDRALHALEADPTGSNRPLHRRVLQQRGWVDLPATRARLTAWLQGADPELKVEAAHAIVALRLADLYETCVSVARLDPRQEVSDATRNAIRRLGGRVAE